jgi:para-aminobenzoate synthetase component 1
LMKTFDEWKKNLAQSEGAFWVQQKNNIQQITTAHGKKSVADFDQGPFPVFTVTDFSGAKNFGWNFDTTKNYQLPINNAAACQPELDSCSRINYEFQTTKEDFVSKVERVKKLAESGQLWVMNLAVDIVFPDLTDDQVLTAFGHWLESDSDKVGSVVWTEELKFVSFSPEIFITQVGQKISTFPIKGTGSREYLDSSEKEKSELNMITDLLRNDLGQIAKTVTVPNTRTLTSHGEFWHAQAEIEATMNRNFTGKDYQYLLPAGSVSGAPKKRVVEYIQEMEDFERNFFTGTFSVRNSDQDLRSSILIRTFFKRDRVWHFPVGVGLTHLSDPESEWKELQQKLEGVLRFF